MTTTQKPVEARPYVSPKLRRPLRDWDTVWIARLEAEAARMEKEKSDG
jgi:hypothetical protein